MTMKKSDVKDVTPRYIPSVDGLPGPGKPGDSALDGSGAFSAKRQSPQGLVQDKAPDAETIQPGDAYSRPAPKMNDHKDGPKG